MASQQPRRAGRGPGLPRGPRPAPALARVLAVLLLAGALAYSTWLTETFLPTGLSPRTSYVSELAASDQPYGAFYRTADLLAGLLVLAAALGALKWLPRAGRWPGVGWVALALFGAATAADSRLPLSCPPTADAGCVAREEAGAVPWTHSAHVVSSGLAVTVALVAMVLLTVAARRSGRCVLARLGPGLVVLELAATCWTLTSIAAFEAGRGTWGLGLGQRLQVLCIAVWLAVLAWSLLTAAAAAQGPSSGARRG